MQKKPYDAYFREAAGALLAVMDPKLRERAELIGAMNKAYIGTARDFELDEAFEGKRSFPCAFSR